MFTTNNLFVIIASLTNQQEENKMKKHLSNVTNKSTLEFLKWGIKNLIDNGKDCFEMQRLCVAYSSDTGIKPTEFYSDLNKMIKFK